MLLVVSKRREGGPEGGGSFGLLTPFLDQPMGRERVGEGWGGVGSIFLEGCDDGEDQY